MKKTGNGLRSEGGWRNETREYGCGRMEKGRSVCGKMCIRDRGKETHAWFVGYAPAEDPRLAVCVIVEEGGSGGRTAGPIAKKLFDAYLIQMCIRDRCGPQNGPEDHPGSEG